VGRNTNHRKQRHNMTRKHFQAIAKILGEQQGKAEFDYNENRSTCYGDGLSAGCAVVKTLIYELSLYFASQHVGFDAELFSDAVDMERKIAMERCETDETYTYDPSDPYGS
jgi:hypothetical protein